MMGSWLSRMASQSSYLQLYWMLQTGRVAVVTAYRLLTYNRPHVTASDPDDRSRGWTEFRKHTKLYNSMAFVWSLYVLWASVNAYCSDVPPSERFQKLFDFTTAPREVTVGSWSTCIGVALYLIHATQRLYEGLRVSIFSELRTVDALTLLSDLAFPVAAGLSLLAHSPDLAIQTDSDLVSSLRWYHVPSVLAFVFACKVQKDTYQQLQKLRRNKFNHIVTTAHKLPRGGWFDRLNVASPHYLAEIIIHVTVGVALGMRSSTWWMLTGYVVLNHIQLAVDRHRFYHQKFDDFPKDRNMLIPYIL